METWNEICYLINNHKEKNSDERFFQNEVENIFEKLGWSRYRKEIISKIKIRIGSDRNRRLEPDITIRLNGKNIFVIELKHPNLYLQNNEYEQLSSYMRQLKLDFGLLIGNTFQLYYDSPNDNERPIKVFETNFTENNLEASNLIKIFEKQNFDEVELRSFCEKKLENLNNLVIADEIVKSLLDNGERKLFELLVNDLKNDYHENIIENVISNLSINVSRKITHSIVSPTKSELQINYSYSSDKRHDTLPIEFIPSDIKLFKKLLLQKKFAIEEIHYEDGKIENKIWTANNFTPDSDVKGNVRSRPLARKGKWKELKIKKIVYKFD